MSRPVPPWLRIGPALAVAALATTLAAAQDAPRPSVAPADVAALFAERCTLCHAGDGAPLGLRLDDLDSVLAGSDRGPVVVPGDPDASELIARLRGTSQPRMPLTGPPFLSEEEIAMVAAWIAAGAPTGAADETPAADAAPAPSAPAAQPGTFADVAPVFAGRCAYCHAPGGAMGPAPEGVVLTSHEAIVASGERAVVVPGAPLASELYRRVAGLATPRMPFDGPPWLDDATIERIRLWIENGAPGPDGAAAPVPVGAEVRLNGTLTGRWSLDGLPLEVTGATRLDDDPRSGDRVEVRGVVSAGGGVRATRIRSR
jgi:mono/diheme cytochrome c family protein